MTTARRRDQQGEPDPGHFERFRHEAVPEMLARCEVSEELAGASAKTSWLARSLSRR